MGFDGEVTISLEGLRDKNVMDLKKLNAAIFPIPFSDLYYATALASGDFTQLAYYSDVCVGSIAWQLEEEEGEDVCAYITALGVLAPYRRLGVGTRLMNHVFDHCSKRNIQEIYLHVQTSNEGAINFYKRMGFEITEKIENYYYNLLDPPDSFVLTKFIPPPYQVKKQQFKARTVQSWEAVGHYCLFEIYFILALLGTQIYFILSMFL